MRLILVALFSLGVAGCYSPNIQNGVQKCNAGACAAGYECGPDGFCYKVGQKPNGGADMAVAVDMGMACTQATCKAPTPICDPDSKQCIPCLTDTHCPDGKLCKNKQCMPGCSMTHGCGDAGMCDPMGMCAVCKVDGDCAANQATPRCDTESGRCVACLPVNDNCTGGQFCKKVNNEYQCQMGCKLDGDCMNGGKCCNNVCVDLQSDGANCGLCGKSCNGMACCAGSCTDTASDIANCGMCGKACTGGHANWSCAMSSCTISGCQGSYKDCNVDPMDGCEINTAADANNCLGCGMKCNLPNAVAGCANGCFVQSCSQGFGNCDNMAANGCEANVAIDKNNCGMCGKVCANVANGFPACSNSICIVGGCINGFDDCDMQVPNGCESKVDSDPNNCGMCGKKCMVPNAVASCVNSVCGVASCNAGFGNCDNMAPNGCEVNTAMDKINCGACGRVCSNANIANPTCGNGICNGACNAGFGDCNNNKLNDGCEKNVTSDPANCGNCGMMCQMAQQCINSMCQSGIHNTVPFVGGMVTNNGCKQFANTGNTNWDNLGMMPWRQCVTEASKRGAMLFSNSYGTTSPGWHGHRLNGVAMIGVWSAYQSADINSNQPCIVARDRRSMINNAPLANSVLYDGMTWRYQDFGAKFYDECQLLAADAGAIIIDPWTLGLGNGDNYWSTTVHTGNTYEWIINNGTAFMYDNVGCDVRSSSHNCMVGYPQ